MNVRGWDRKVVERLLEFEVRNASILPYLLFSLKFPLKSLQIAVKFSPILFSKISQTQVPSNLHKKTNKTKLHFIFFYVAFIHVKALQNFFFLFYKILFYRDMKELSFQLYKISKKVKVHIEKNVFLLPLKEFFNRIEWNKKIMITNGRL